MIPAAIAVFVCTVAVDLRASFDRLAALARQHVGRDPLTNVALYLFLNRARTHAKVLWWDRSGWALLYKRLERGTFHLPTAFNRARRDARPHRSQGAGAHPRRHRSALAAPSPAASPATRAGRTVDAGRDKMITELWRGLARASVSA